MIRRALTAAAVALAVFACCAAVSVLHRARIVAYVDGASLPSTLTHRWSIVLTAWRQSMGTSDWLLFLGLSALAGALALGRPFLVRLATSRRGTE